MEVGLNTTKQKTFYKIGELAEMFGVSVSAIRRLKERRQIKFYKIGGSIRFKSVDIEAYLKNNCIKPINE